MNDKEAQQLIDQNARLAAELADLRSERDALKGQAELVPGLEEQLKLCHLPESPFSMNWTMIDNYGANVQITARLGVDKQVIIEAMRTRKDYIDAALSSGWKFLEKAQPAPLGDTVLTGGNGAKPDSPYFWKMEGGAIKMHKGKMVLVLRGQTGEPNEVPCPQHQGKTMKRRTNDNGSWLSHKTGDDSYCSAVFEREV